METIDQELQQSKRILARLLKEKEDMLRSNPLALFVPNSGGQEEFFNQADKFSRSVFSGNRFGKSTAGVVEDCCWLLGFRPFYPEGHPLRTLGIPKHGVKGLVIASTWEKVRDIFTREGDPRTDDRVGKFFHFLPPNCISSVVHNQHGVVSQIEIKSEVYGRERKSTLVFDTVRSFLSNPLDKESSDWDFVHIDEPIPEDFWIAVSRGLIDRGGKTWWLMTPKTEPWMFYQASENEKENPDRYWTYQGDTDENVTLSAQAKEDYFGNLSEDELACRKSGRPVALSRLVISNFNREVHVLKNKPVGWASSIHPPEEYAICAATDTHPQTPHATLMVAISPLEDIFIYDERFKKGPIKGENSISEWLKEKQEFARCLYYLLEPGAWVEDQTTGRRYVDDFYEAGLNPEKGSKKRKENIILMNDLFGQRDRKVYVLSHCRVFLSEIERWYFDKDDKPVDKDDHMMENFGRLLAHDNFKYHSPWVPSKVLEVPETFSEAIPAGYGEPADMSV
jgi:hypothetical protein